VGHTTAACASTGIASGTVVRLASCSNLEDLPLEADTFNKTGACSTEETSWSAWASTFTKASSLAEAF
jgi:hypothetical protein